jgi:hypothetical protein
MDYHVQVDEMIEVGDSVATPTARSFERQSA